jgi:hypothetical protein
MGSSCCCCVGVRTLVSKKKKRTVLSKDESPIPGTAVNLDLWPVHDRVVAMGFPSTGAEALYRNPVDEVKEYLDARYGKGNYWVYNLCSEAKHQYEDDRFEGRVSRFPFRDHTPCPLEMSFDFVAHAVEWLSKDPSHVVVIHCKAGKGRTGLMICCLLLEIMPELEGDAARAIEYYGQERTEDGKGLTHRSQIRYVHYFAQARQLGRSAISNSPTHHLIGVRIAHLHNLAAFSKLVIERPGSDDVVLDDANATFEKSSDGGTLAIMRKSGPLAIKGDFRLELVGRSCVGAVSANTYFIEPNRPVFYGFREVDKLYKL